ncbi:MAG: CvpA family protein [Acidobacteria bacterium]|nr:CvpA family protein [Acidobacteriota bacterium]MBV9146535.1 CvpA family protein [Acidobacteriota bacterium]MBV9437977.1 CvpA family protein [Acidobacteriota bacterium]
MTLFDWGVVGVFLLSILLAAAQGFFYEIFSLAGVVLGYLSAVWGYHRLSGVFRPYVNATQYADVAAFLTIFFAVLIFAGMVGRIARWAMKEAGLRGIDRFLGGVFGLVRGVAIVTVGVLAIAAFAPDNQALSRSSLGGYFLVAARTATWIAPYELRARVRSGAQAIAHLQETAEINAESAQKAAPAAAPK